jgi:hypothetical protein
MMTQTEDVEQRLATLLEIVHTLGRNLAADGVSGQAGFRHSALDGLRAAVNDAFKLGQELHGDTFTDGAGPDDTCGCSGRITWYRGRWVHIINPALRSADDHPATPATPAGGDYEPAREGE